MLIININDINVDSKVWGNYYNSTGNAEVNSGSRQKTGKSEYWKVNNIYDLAGNVSEYTQEIYSTSKNYVYRGGSYYESIANTSVARRYYNVWGPTTAYGFRICFYL